MVDRQIIDEWIVKAEKTPLLMPCRTVAAI